MSAWRNDTKRSFGDAQHQVTRVTGSSARLDVRIICEPTADLACGSLMVVFDLGEEL